MSKKRIYKYLACDFETTVFEKQEDTRVWASGICELFTEDFVLLGSIEDTFNYFKSLKSNIIAYYHNLKFDGSFWLDFLLKELKMKQAFFNFSSQNELALEQIDTQKMENNTFKYSISDMGQWYSITIKINDFIIELRDSLKLLPFTLAKIGKDFKLKHQKLDMEYTGLRYPNCKISDEERAYIMNDVFVLKEGLEFMFSQNHDKLTIGSCCLSEYKTILTTKIYNSLFPDLTKMILSGNFNYENADTYIRRSYKGGWCYLVKGCENKVLKNGLTIDVNSLYPFVMHSMSGSIYPIGTPMFWKGNRIPKVAQDGEHYYFIRIKTRFYLKKSHLPFIQIKGSFYYNGNECLTTSDVYYNGEYYRYIKNIDGYLTATTVTLTLTMTDYKLFLEHYDVEDFEILDGCYFETEKYLFDTYIDKYREIKENNEGALRTLAKLFSNNLYGKMASSDESSFKYAYLDETEKIKFALIEEHNKRSGFIAVGSAITSYARNWTIRHAQANYYNGKKGFVYADTDSLHCYDLSAEELKNIQVDSKKYGDWKLESSWDFAIFVRQKTYIEHVTHENLKPLETPYYNIKCAGMPDTCKELLNASLTGEISEKCEKVIKNDEKKRAFCEKKRTLKDFKVGLEVPGKLMPKRIDGGILLVESNYKLRM